jgi:methyltransferase
MAIVPELIGPPQIAALAVLVQRGAEELYSQRNTRRLLREGGHEAGHDYYPLVAVTHLAWIASVFFLIPPTAPIHWPALLLYLALQIARYWIIGSLGRYWTHRIITLGGAPIVRRGPYRYVRHPNYAVACAETLLLPLAFGSLALAIIMTAIYAAAIRYKIVLEEQALAPRRATADKIEG